MLENVLETARRVLELDEKATPGPWEWIGPLPDDYYQVLVCRNAAVGVDREDAKVLGDGGVDLGLIAADVSIDRISTDLRMPKDAVLQDDLELIALYRAAAPMLARALLAQPVDMAVMAGYEAAQWEVDALKKENAHLRALLAEQNPAERRGNKP